MTPIEKEFWAELEEMPTEDHITIMRVTQAKITEFMEKEPIADESGTDQEV